MKQSFRLLFIAVIVLASITSFAQKKKKVLGGELPEKPVIDYRIDNMGYWRRLAQEKLVPVQPNVKVPSAKNYNTKLVSRFSVTEDSPDVLITDEAGHQTENSIFVSRTDNTHVINGNNSGNGGNVFGADALFTDDSGLTWSGSVQGSGGSNSGDPAVAIGPTGRYYNGLIHSSGGQAVAWSDDGENWTQVVCGVGAGGFFDLLDKNHLWVDNSPSSPYNGNVYSSWTAFGGANDNEIEFTYSSDNAESWSTPQNISSVVNAGNHNQGVNINTGPNGEVYAIWTIYDDWPSDEDAIAMGRSLDGGETFESFRIIEDLRGIRSSETSKNMRVNSFPTMTVDVSDGPNSGAIYVTWANIGVPGINTGNDIDIYLIKSIDGGDTWTEPMKVNTDEAGQGHEHFFPWITSDPSTGFLAIVFYDDRNVGGNQLETFVATSIDGGNVWEDFKVSDISFTPSPIPGLATGYFGDYLGISMSGGMVYPVWSDNRSGGALTYTSPFMLGPPPNTPWIVYEDHTINDPSGNNNGLADYGESVTVDLSLFNWGDTDAQDVNILVSTDSPYVTITDDNASFGDINVDQIVSVDDAFAFNVAFDAPDNMGVIFDILATDANDVEFTFSMSVTVYAPELTILGRTIDDVAGNNNMRLDPGELIEYIVPIENSGSYLVQDIDVNITSDSPYIEFISNNQTITNLPSGISSDVSFTFSISADAPIGSYATFLVDAQSQYHNDEKSFSESIGLIIEDWESNDFINFDWENEAAFPWVIVEDVVYDGDYSSKSASISDGGSTSLSLTYSVFEDDNISFAYKVSSEATYDFLQFFIDDDMVGSWAGEIDWTETTFPVTAGEHIFKWTYMKDGTTANGDDAAWIDNIILPRELATTAYAGTDAGVCIDDSYVLNGQATLYETVLWSTDGDGLFDDATILNAEYTPGTSDIENGSVELTLTVEGPSNTEVNSMMLDIVGHIEADMAESMLVCGDGNIEIIDFIVINYHSVIWSSNGDGILEDANTINPIYTPGINDYANGNVTLEVEIYGLGTCDNLSKTKELQLNSLAMVTLNNSTEVNVCSGSVLTIEGTVVGSGPWTIFIDEDTSFEVDAADWTYDFIPTENQDFTLLKVVDALGCENTIEGMINITMIDIPMVSLTNQEACSTSSIEIDATTEGSNTYYWEHSGETEAIVNIDATDGVFGEVIYSVLVTNSETNCATTAEVTIDWKDCTGLNELLDNVSITIYPNPSDGKFKVDLKSNQPERVSISIIDAKGKTIEKEDVELDNTGISKRYDLTNLAKGVYFLKLENNKSSLTKKIIIK